MPSPSPLFVASSGRCSCCGLMVGQPPNHTFRVMGIEAHDEMICERCLHNTLHVFSDLRTTERSRLRAHSDLRLHCSACKRPRHEVIGLLPLSEGCRLCDQCLHQAARQLEALSPSTALPASPFAPWD